MSSVEVVYYLKNFEENIIDPGSITGTKEVMHINRLRDEDPHTSRDGDQLTEIRLRSSKRTTRMQCGGS
jgi:hypothetical protein